MSSKITKKVEYGDFQTPDVLCQKICNLLCDLNISPKSVVEPTCGTGSFLRASVNAFPQCETTLGFEINPDYVMISRTVAQASVQCEDFFEKDWPTTLNSLKEPILIIGNPPWVTNAVVGTLSGKNLPTKSNFQRLNGFDAITGKSNFDISEWMLLHLLEWLSGRSAVLAMLCKTMVARKVLKYAWSKDLQVKASAIYSVNALEYFGAAVDACLLICILEPGTTTQECAVHPKLDARTPDSVVAFRNGRLVANLKTLERYEHLYGRSPFKWRSGIKHDCARVMELRPNGPSAFKNGFGEIVNLETAFLHPMLKSSELMKSDPTPSRYMLVTQRNIGEDTSQIRREAPRTWSYLERHASRLDKRASSIYRNRPLFSVFGVGPYAFTPWKVAISGFYKSLQFRAVGPMHGKPVVFDDTCYFLPCQTENEARGLLKLVNSEMARGFFSSFVFWDAKRPITADLLGSLNLNALSAELGVSLPGRAGETFELPVWERGESIISKDGSTEGGSTELMNTECQTLGMVQG